MKLEVNATDEKITRRIKINRQEELTPVFFGVCLQLFWATQNHAASLHLLFQLKAITAISVDG